MIEEDEKPSVGSARNAARVLLKKCQISVSPVYLRDVVRFLCKNYPLKVVGWSFGSGLDGIQVIIGDEAAIAYNKDTHWHRQRFTLAHEIGHFVLGHTQEHSSALLGKGTPSETEAKKFAAELLMPLNFIKKDIGQGVNNVAGLAKKYLVSEQAMWVRVQECNLLKLLTK